MRTFYDIRKGTSADSPIHNPNQIISSLAIALETAKVLSREIDTPVVSVFAGKMILAIYRNGVATTGV